jgi:hypothetical protein
VSIVSRLAAAEQALYDLLVARAAMPGSALENVQIDQGFPGTDLLAAEHVWLAEETDARQEWQITGTGSEAKTEIGTLEVWVWVVTPGNDYVTSRDRGLALLAEVEEAVRADFHLAGQVFDAQVVRVRKTAAPTGESRGLFLQVFVEYVAWLS